MVGPLPLAGRQTRAATTRAVLGGGAWHLKLVPHMLYASQSSLSKINSSVLFVFKIKERLLSKTIKTRIPYISVFLLIFFLWIPSPKVSQPKYLAFPPSYRTSPPPIGYPPTTHTAGRMRSSPPSQPIMSQSVPTSQRLI